MDPTGCTPILSRLSEYFTVALDVGAKIKAQNPDQNSPLHLTCLYGHTNCCKALLYFAEHMKIPIEVDLQNKHGDTALAIAAKFGFTEMVACLLENNARVDVINKFANSPIQVAHNSKIRLLLQEALMNMIHSPRGTKNVWISEADMMDNENQVPKNLLNKMDKISKTLMAIAENDTKMALFLLGISGDEKESSKCHPLCSCEACIKTRTRRSSDAIDINDQDPTSGNTPLHVATLLGNIKLVKILLTNGADITRCNSQQQCALHVACKVGRSQLVSCLLSAPPTTDLVDLKDANGDTPLHLAAATGDAKLLETLLNYEPSLDIKNADGKTPLDIARENFFLSSLKILEKCQEQLSNLSESDAN